MNVANDFDYKQTASIRGKNLQLLVNKLSRHFSNKIRVENCDAEVRYHFAEGLAKLRSGDEAGERLFIEVWSFDRDGLEQIILTLDSHLLRFSKEALSPYEWT